jgi:hypothetical protein
MYWDIKPRTNERLVQIARDINAITADVVSDKGRHLSIRHIPTEQHILWRYDPLEDNWLKWKWWAFVDKEDR